MILVHFFCDLCNPSCQVRDAGSEMTHGYAALAIKGTDTLDFAVPGLWEAVERIPRTGMAGFICPHCVERIEKGEHPAQLANAAAGEHDPDPTPGHRWPSLSSPFDDA